MRRKFLATALAFSAVAGAAVFSLAAPASGQTGTGYPPALCTATTGTQDVGTVTVGQQFVLQLAPVCLFTPGATVSVNANGVTFSDVAEPNGTVLLNVNVLSTTQLSINPNVPARCGVNTVTATGPSRTAQGGTVTQTANFTLACPATGGTGGTTGGVLSRTGADTLQYAGVAMALVVAGSLVVLVTRRRRADGTTA